MINFEFNLPNKIIFGAGEIKRSGALAARLGKRAIVVIGQGSVKRHGYYDIAINSLRESNVDFLTFEGVEPNPRSTTIDRAGVIAKKEKVDFLIGLGGGSVMDATKAIAVRALADYPVWDFVRGENGGRPRPIIHALPTMMIPTIAATSSETDSGGVITNWERHEKCAIFSPHLSPKITIIDPGLTVTVGKDTTADGAVDIISHVLEGYLSGDPNAPIQDRFSEGIIRTVMEFAPKAIDKPDDLGARSNLSWCASIALSGIVNSGRGGNYPIHLLEHSISAHYDISHGAGLALLIPPMMRFTGKAVPQRLESLGRNLFFRTKINAEGTIILFEKWLESIAKKITFGEIGIDNAKFEAMADDIIRMYGGNEGCIVNPRPIYKKDIIDIFESVA